MPADWQHEDNIVVTATDYLPGHAEQLQVDSVSGTTVTLIGTVKNPHWGQTYSLASVPCNPAQGPDHDPIRSRPAAGRGSKDRNVDMRAAVGLLSRSIRIVSDGGHGGDSSLHRVITADTPWCARDSCRTRSRESSSINWDRVDEGPLSGALPHGAPDTAPDTYVKDSSMWDSMTRWITIHATQGVTLARNVGYKSIGHGFYLEDGTEADNVLNTNLGVFARAAVQNAQNDRNVPGILAEPGDARCDLIRLPFRLAVPHRVLDHERLERVPVQLCFFGGDLRRLLLAAAGGHQQSVAI